MNKSMFDYELCPIISIITDDDKKRYIHYHGHAYLVDLVSRDYHLINYTFAVFDFQFVLNNGGVVIFMLKNDEFFKQTIHTCTENEIVNIFNTYNNGAKPTVIREALINMNIPDGMYIVTSPLTTKYDEEALI